MGDDHELIKENEALATEAQFAPVTFKRKVHDDLETFLPKPYLARALVAPDVEHSTGTVGHKHKDLSVLQQHVAFFDQDHDGILYPWESFRGLRAIGLDPAISFVASNLFHLAFSYPTLDGWVPYPYLPIYIRNIHKAKHGSDSGTYDTEGRIASKMKWGLVHYLAKDEHGFVSKEDIRSLFDGSLFENLAKKHSGGQAKMG